MKTFSNTCAQGDVYFRRLPAITPIPNGAIRIEPVNGFVKIAESETHHDHVMDAAAVTMYRLPDSIMDCLLVVNEPTTLRHLREHDTHEPILFEKGTFHVRRQQEYTPEGLRRVED